MLSVIIPTFNEASALHKTIEHLSEFQDRLEVITADGGSQDGTLELLANYPWIKVVHAGRGRGLQLNRGAEAATHQIYLFLHAGTRLPGDWVSAVEKAAARPDFAFGAFRLKIDSTHPGLRLVEFFQNHRARVHSLPVGQQVIFTKKRHFWGVGGFPDSPIMEDLELVQKLIWRGNFVLLKHHAVASAKRWESDGILRHLWLQKSLLKEYRRGIDAETLARKYNPPEECMLGIFCKYPEPGKVLNALTTVLGAKAAAEICRELATLTLNRADAVGKVSGLKSIIFFSPPEKRREMVNWLGYSRFYLPQPSGEMSERLLQVASEQLRSGFKKIVLISANHPDLASWHIEKAFELLETNEVVLGPATSGKYYLIGLKQALPVLFTGIYWRSGDVYRLTLDRVRSSGLKHAVLPELHSLETAQDLNFFQKNLGLFRGLN